MNTYPFLCPLYYNFPDVLTILTYTKSDEEFEYNHKFLLTEIKLEVKTMLLIQRINYHYQLLQNDKFRNSSSR